MNRFRLEYLVEKEGILREFLTEKEISKRTLTAVKYQGGKLLVNEIERDVRYRLQAGDCVKVIFPPEKLSEGLLAEEGMLDIVYEDDLILLIQKPFGIHTIPSFLHRSSTIANFVAGKFKKEQIPATVHIVTRLDHDTSGLLCIAKNRHIHHLLSKQLTDATFKRSYEAIVEGHIKKSEFIIHEPIGRKEGSIIERVVRQDGQNAKTQVRVIEKFEVNGHPFTRVALTLETGRTHQIRVHMSWMGHPLAGDDLYGGNRNYISRQALHCTTLSFLHPITKEEKLFESTLAADMKNMLTRNE